MKTKINKIEKLLLAIFGLLLITGIVTAEIMNIKGTLEAGVELGCIILKGDDGKMYQLTNLSIDTIPFGSRVSVNGTIETDVVSYCMQGTSFKVSDISLLNKTKGDVDKDGVVTTADALLYLRYAVGQNISPYKIDNSDYVTCDNKITVADAFYVLRESMGQDPNYSYKGSPICNDATKV